MTISKAYLFEVNEAIQKANAILDTLYASDSVKLGSDVAKSISDARLALCDAAGLKHYCKSEEQLTITS